MTRPTRRREGRGKGRRGRRGGVGGTWRTKGAVESNGGNTVGGGEVERGLTPVAQTEINSVKELS